MTYKIWVTDEKVPFLIEELGEDKVKIIESPKEGEILTGIELTIDGSTDVLRVFMAGWMFGVKKLL